MRRARAAGGAAGGAEQAAPVAVPLARALGAAGRARAAGRALLPAAAAAVLMHGHLGPAGVRLAPAPTVVDF